jgi:hypothetical protein
VVFGRSSLTRWRRRRGEEKLVALIQESLAAATAYRTLHHPSSSQRLGILIGSGVSKKERTTS